MQEIRNLSADRKGSPDTTVPIGPIRAALEDELQIRTSEDLAFAIWPEKDAETRERHLRRVLHDKTEIEFEDADRILCELELVHRWYSDPELAEAYAEVPLYILDLRDPVGDEAFADTGRECAGLLERLSGVHSAAEKVMRCRWKTIATAIQAAA